MSNRIERAQRCPGGSILLAHYQYGQHNPAIKIRALEMCWNFDETQRDLVLYFTTPKIVTESEVHEIGLGFQDICKLAASVHKNLVIDFRGVEFMSSVLMGEIVLLNKAALTNNVKIGFMNVGPQVLEVFKICRLDKVFRLHGGNGGQEPTGAMVPRPRRPSSDTGHADPPSST